MLPGLVKTAPPAILTGEPTIRCPMPRLPHALAIISLALLIGCAAGQRPPEAGQTSAAAGPVPVGLRLSLAGDTAPVLGPDGEGRLTLARADADDPLSLDFRNQALAVHGLAPGRYEITRLGRLQCRGLAFEVPEGTGARYLGTLSGELVRANYHVALMAPPTIDPADAGALAETAGIAPERVDSRPLAVREAAPCFLGRDGPVTTWEDLSLSDKIFLSIGVAGLCAISVATGGFCQF